MLDMKLVHSDWPDVTIPLLTSYCCELDPNPELVAVHRSGLMAGDGRPPVNREFGWPRIRVLWDESTHYEIVNLQNRFRRHSQVEGEELDVDALVDAFVYGHEFGRRLLHAFVLHAQELVHIIVV